MSDLFASKYFGAEVNFFCIIGPVHVKLNKKSKWKRIESQQGVILVFIFCLLTLYEYVFGNILPKETAINWQKKDIKPLLMNDYTIHSFTFKVLW